MRAGAYQVPRPETYVRDLGTPKRRGCQNSILDARSLRRGLHPPHLHPRYKTDAAKGRGENGQFHGAGHVSRKSKNTGEKAKASSPVLFGSIGIIPRVGHGVGQAVDPHFDPHLFQRFCNKKHRKPKFSMLFGAGGVTRTHDLLITNYDSFVSPISVNARKVLCCKASGVFVFRGISPIWAGFG